MSAVAPMSVEFGRVLCRALSHALDMAGMLPENLLIQELDRSQLKLSRMAPEC